MDHKLGKKTGEEAGLRYKSINLRISDPAHRKIPLQRGVIDKCHFRLPHSQQIKKLKTTLDQMGLKWSIEAFGWDNWFFIIEPKKLGILVPIAWKNCPFYQKVITNPSYFSHFKEFDAFIKSIFTSPLVDEAVISRLDVATDYEERVDRFIMGVVVKHKQAHTQYRIGSKRTGAQWGNYPEVLIAYDWAMKHKHGGLVRTRLEAQIHGAKLPIKTFAELPRLRNIREEYDGNSLLRNTVCYCIELVPESDIKDGKARSLFAKLEAMLEANGLWYAMKKLNRNGNFRRTFGQFFRVWEKRVDQPFDVI